MSAGELSEPERPVLILDANALRSDLFFRKNASRLALWEAHEGRLRLVIPEVARDEALNLYREAVIKQQAAIRNAVRELEGLRAPVNIDAQQLGVTAAAAAYEQQLQGVLDYAGAELAPYPDVSHEEVVRRSLRRSPPFSHDGKDGYRDTLIWESIKALVKANPTADFTLVSADSRAFSPDKDSTEITDGLRAELEEFADPPKITRVADLKSFTDLHIPNADEQQVEVNHRLATEEDFREGLREQIAGQLLSISIPNPTRRSLPFDIGVDPERIEVDGVSDVQDLAIGSVKKWRESLLVEISGEATVGLELWIRRHDAAALFDEGEVTDVGNGLVSVFEFADVELFADAIYEDRELTVESVHVPELSV